MNRILVIAVAVLTLAFCAQLADAAELTLDDCIDIALENRAAVIRARGNLAVANDNKLAAIGAFLPRVSANYEWSKSEGTIEVQDVEEDFTNDPGGRLSLSAGISVSDLVSDVLNIGVAQADKQSARLNVLASENDMIYSVKSSYYAYLATLENVDVQTDAVARAEEQLKLIESRYELGSASRSDVLKQRVQYGNDQLALLNAQNAVVESAANLAYTIGLDPKVDHQFATEYDVREFDGTLDEAIQFGLVNNPSVLSSEYSLKSAKKSLLSARSSYLPSLGLGASWSRSEYNQYEAVIDDYLDYTQTSKTWGFNLSWNIFDGFSRERSVTSARINRNNAMASLADVRNATVSDVKTAYLEIERLKEQQKVSQENVDAAEEDLRITLEKNDLGAATILDLLDAQVSMKQAQVALIQAEFDLNLAIAKLENAIGKR